VTALAAYEAGLVGAECWFRTGDGSRRRLPVARWAAEADDGDQHLIGAVMAGARPGARVLDAGCGPGRLTAALTAAGRHLGTSTLGVDVSTVAVGLARARGVTAVRADILAPPLSLRERRWDRILLADGNLGIGGDPARLLRRTSTLLAPGGRIVADVRAEGDVVRGPAWIESVDGCGGEVGGPVPWAWVGLDAVESLARQAGLGSPRICGAGRADRRIVVWEALR
jgi:SAM-dependent methyltransferase